MKCEHLRKTCKRPCRHKTNRDVARPTKKIEGGYSDHSREFQST
jgi:hypothetical protein